MNLGGKSTAGQGTPQETDAIIEPSAGGSS